MRERGFEGTPHVLGRRPPPAHPGRFRPPRPGDALRNQRTDAGYLVRPAAAARAPGAARREGAAVRLRLRRESELRPALGRRHFVRGVARAGGRVAALARRHRDAQGPDRGAEFYRAPAFARRPAGRGRIDAALAFLARPDRRRSFGDWLRMLMEDLLVIDAATIYPRYDRAGKLYSLDVVDGATVKP